MTVKYRRYGEFSDEERDLADTMSDISEDCWCAGWLIGLEYSLWDAIQTGDLEFGMATINSYDLKRCKELADKVNGWVVWMDNGHGLPIGQWGNYFIPMNDWLKMYEEEKSKWLKASEQREATL